MDGLFLEDPLQWLNIFNDCSVNDAVISETVDCQSDGPSTYNTYNLQHFIETNLDHFQLSFLEDDI